MNHILVLVDFTETANIAADQAVFIAKLKGSKITFCHINTSSGKSDDEILSEMAVYNEKANAEGLESKSIVSKGSFNSEVAAAVNQLVPNLVIVGTHGKHGLKQNLLGSNIYKLVTGQSSSVMVVSDLLSPTEGGFNKVLLPVAPHDNFLSKVRQASDLMNPDGKAILFSINKPGVELTDAVVANIKAAEVYFNENNIAWEMVTIDMVNFSIGYSKDTLAFAKSNGIDLIALMTSISDDNRYFGKVDKENIILNDGGIPVLNVVQ